MYRFCLYLTVAIAVILSASLANADGVCTGYPKMYNGKPCASTTRYWDGQMGACGCGTGNTNPFSWQWTKPTAAASAPIYGSGTWCGSGCGKCFKLTPTAIGASAEGTGAPALDSLVVKVTNLCPYAGNEAWCAYDVNSFGYEAHFDLMDYNMAGVVSSMGWNNPEVTYEEVDCAANGYTDWNCQCADGASTVTPSATDAPTTAPASATKAPTTAAVPATEAPAPATEAPAPATEAPATATDAPTTAPVRATKRPTKRPTSEPAVTKAQATEAPVAPTEAPISPTEAPIAIATDAPVPDTEAPVVAATDAPVVDEPSTAATDAPVSSESPSTGTDIQIQVNGGSNAWWFGFSLVNIAVSDISSVEIKDSSENALWTRMSYQGNEYWNMYSVNPANQMKAPLSLRFTGVNRNVVTADNIISAFQSATLDTGVAL